MEKAILLRSLPWRNPNQSHFHSVSMKILLWKMIVPIKTPVIYHISRLVPKSRSSRMSHVRLQLKRNRLKKEHPQQRFLQKTLLLLIIVLLVAVLLYPWFKPTKMRMELLLSRLRFLKEDSLESNSWRPLNYLWLALWTSFRRVNLTLLNSEEE